MLMTRTFAPGSFVNNVRRELDDAFQQAFGNGHTYAGSPHLPLTIWEDGEHVYVEADMPGFNRETIDLTYQDGKLWIKSERKVPRDDGKYWHNERMFGRFERAVSLPEMIDVEKIEAEWDEGVLYITLAKKPEARPTKISVKSIGNGQRKRLTDNEKKS